MSDLDDRSRGNDPLQLVERIRAGDVQAYAALVEQYLQPLTRYAYSFTRDETAHDVVQDVFARIWSLGPRWNPHGNLVAYLFGSVRNRAVDLARSEQTNQRVRESLQRDPPHADAESLDAASDVVLTASVRQEIAALTARQREAIRLRYNYGHSASQIAQILGVSTKSAEKLLSRALGTLRERLARFRGER